jgi:hypothetical protein
MAFARLHVEASRLPDWIHAVNHSYNDNLTLAEAEVKLKLARSGGQVTISPAAQSLNALVRWAELDIGKLQEPIDRHFKAQRAIIERIENAIPDLSRSYPDVLLFLSGSVAKLEYVDKVSDVDFIGMTSEESPYGIEDIGLEMDAQSGVDWIRGLLRPFRSHSSLQRIRELHARFEVLEGRIKKTSGIGNLEISGKPFFGKEYFFTANELIDKLGEFDEPSWAVSHRASVLFESEIFESNQAVLERCDEIRSKINRSYRISADLRGFHFPLLGALLVTFLTKSGVLAKISWLKSPASRDPKVEESGRRDNELLKTIGGRIWSSAAHLMLFHVLYWATKLLTQSERARLLERFVRNSREFDEASIKGVLYKTPICKMLEVIPHLIGRIKVAMSDDGWPREQHYNAKTKEEVKETFKAIYRFLGPLDSSESTRFFDADGTGSVVSIIPMPYIYLCLLLVLRQARERKLSVPQERDNDIMTLNRELYLCLAKCEQLTALLIRESTGTDEEMRYLKLFGGEVFDKAVYSQILQ